LAGDGFSNEAFSAHHKKVEQLLRSIRDQLGVIQRQTDPLRPQKIQQVLAALRLQFPAAAARLDEAFAAEVLDTKHSADRTALMLIEMEPKPKSTTESLATIERTWTAWADGLLKRAAAYGISEADARDRILKVWKSAQF
jgi:hypothetical protein